MDPNEMIDMVKASEPRISKPDGGPAFPTVIKNHVPGEPLKVKEDYYPGMTLRDWFAGMAMMEMHTNVKRNNDSTGHIALEAYTQADAMIAEREKANDFVPKATPYDTSGSRGEPLNPA